MLLRAMRLEMLPPAHWLLSAVPPEMMRTSEALAWEIYPRSHLKPVFVVSPESPDTVSAKPAVMIRDEFQVFSVLIPATTRLLAWTELSKVHAAIVVPSNTA